MIWFSPGRPSAKKKIINTFTYSKHDALRSMKQGSCIMHHWTNLNCNRCKMCGQARCRITCATWLLASQLRENSCPLPYSEFAPHNCKLPEMEILIRFDFFIPRTASSNRFTFHSISKKMIKKFFARIQIWERSVLDLHLPFLQARVVFSCRVTNRPFPFVFSRRCLLALSRVVFPFFVKLILAFSNRSPSYLIRNFTGEKICCWKSHRLDRKSLSDKFTLVTESDTLVVGSFALLSLIMVFTKIAPAVHLRHAENLI